MNIAILTIQSVNYGNRLQNYALQTVLNGLGNQAHSLRRDAGFNGPVGCKLRAIKHGLGVLRHRSDSYGAFRRFDNNYISFSDSVVSKEYTSPNLNDAYGCYVIGSDQVWNPDFDFNSELEYLPMVSSGKKLAYAASFGVSEIVENRERTAELLTKISAISVREAAGAGIIRELTGRDVPVVLDPTLLLGPSDWEKVSKKPDKLNLRRPYVFKYVLGDDVNDDRIAVLAASRGFGVIDAMNSSLAIGPSEFVWLIAHSELVCTDSFHASVFALLHHKPLAIFERVSADADMSSRFDTLCANFGLVGHRSSEDSFGEDAIFAADWDDVEARLAKLRDASQAWLKSALNGVARG